MAKLNEIQKAYLAGYFDGEGCIFIGLKGQRVVQIKSCYPKVVQLFNKIFGGRLYRGRSNQSKYWRDHFYFRVFGKEAVNVIKHLYPFLREKKEQARLFLKHDASKDAHTKAQYAVQIKSLKKVIY